MIERASHGRCADVTNSDGFRTRARDSVRMHVSRLRKGLAGEARGARKGVEEALGGWRAPPFAGVNADTLLGAERARLEEERLAAVNEGPRRARPVNAGCRCRPTG